MMIGKTNWFTYRIFGWGLRPKTWQGWAYIFVFMALVFAVSLLPVTDSIKQIAMISLTVILLIDTLHMMFSLEKVHDERQNMQQLIIERNVSYAAVFSILAVMLFQTYRYQIENGMETFSFDASLIIVLAVMFLTKVGSTLYTMWKM